MRGIFDVLRFYRPFEIGSIGYQIGELENCFVKVVGKVSARSLYCTAQAFQSQPSNTPINRETYQSLAHLSNQPRQTARALVAGGGKTGATALLATIGPKALQRTPKTTEEVPILSVKLKPTTLLNLHAYLATLKQRNLPQHNSSDLRYTAGTAWPWGH